MTKASLRSLTAYLSIAESLLPQFRSLTDSAVQNHSFRQKLEKTSELKHALDCLLSAYLWLHTAFNHSNKIIPFPKCPKL